MSVREILGILGALAFIALAVFMFIPSPQPDIHVTLASSLSSALWEFRFLDVFLQLLIILAGTFSILILVKEK